MALKETAGLYETLKAEWNKKNPSLSKCGELLSKLKVESYIESSVFYVMGRSRSTAYLEALALLAIVATCANLG